MKLLIFQSHVIQYYSGLWRNLSSQIDHKMSVIYFSDSGYSSKADDDFGKSIEWDIDLLSGYNSKFLTSVAPSSFYCQIKMIFSALIKLINSTKNSERVIICGYTIPMNWIVLFLCKIRKTRVYCISDVPAIRWSQQNRFRNLIKKLVIKFFAKNIHKFLCCSDSARQYFHLIGIDEKQTIRLPYSIDCKQFSPISHKSKSSLQKQLKITKDQFIVGFCGKLIDRKNPLEILAAVHAISNSNTKVIIIGSGPLKSQVDKIGKDFVIFCDFVNQSKIADYLAVCDVLVLPSKVENYGIVAIEAAAMGTPTIATTVCGCVGNNEIVIENETGFSYTSGNPPELSALLVKLESNRQLLENISFNSGIKSKEFCQNVIAQKMFKLLFD